MAPTNKHQEKSALTATATPVKPDHEAVPHAANGGVAKSKNAKKKAKHAPSANIQPLIRDLTKQLGLQGSSDAYRMIASIVTSIVNNALDVTSTMCERHGKITIRPEDIFRGLYAVDIPLSILKDIAVDFNAHVKEVEAKAKKTNGAGGV